MNIEEKTTFEICNKYNLLSPLYEMNIGRDGCFFCPNAAVKARELLKKEYPEYVQLIYEMIGKTNVDSIMRLKGRNNWIKDYLENGGKLEKPQPKEEPQLEGQTTIFDFL